jgi:magnesium transporter
MSEQDRSSDSPEQAMPSQESRGGERAEFPAAIEAELKPESALPVDPAELAEVVEKQDAPDAADTLEKLEDQDVANVLGEMDDQAAANALAEMNLPLAISVLDDMVDDEPHYAALLLEMMAPDDAADLLQALDADRRARLLAAIDPESANDLAQLIRYDEESAGGLMTTDVLTLREDMTVEDAIEQIRGSEMPEWVNDLPVVNDQNQLKGLVNLRSLLLARRGHRIESIMETVVDAIPPEMDREAVAREFDRYDYSMLPVVDAAGRLLGIITVDDVIDIIRKEQTEDVQKSVGAGAGEAVYSPMADKVKGRFPWLTVSMLTTAFAAVVVAVYEGLIVEIPILAVFMPVIAALSGNAGQQAMAVTLRGIVLEEVRRERIAPLIVREGLVGLFNGMCLGMLLGAGAVLLGSFTESSNWRLGAIAAGSLVISMGTGTLAGSGIPLIMRRLGFDPATASSIFLIMITDAMSFLTLLGATSRLHAWVVGDSSIG